VVLLITGVLVDRLEYVNGWLIKTSLNFIQMNTKMKFEAKWNISWHCSIIIGYAMVKIVN